MRETIRSAVPRPRWSLSAGALIAGLTLLVAACAQGGQTPTGGAAAKPAQQPASTQQQPAQAAQQPAQAAQQPAQAAAKPAAQTTDLQSLRGTVRVDGSSTVFPVSEAMAEEFQKATRGNVRVTVGISGTGGGFKKFCADETDVSNASRPIRVSEIQECLAKGVQFIELPVAFDGLSVMVSPRNTFVDCVTVAELKSMWQPSAQGTVTRWSQVRQGWPDQTFRLFGAGPDSGTFDYFTDAINGREKDSRGDYVASEDDNVLVQGISNDANALGYFGYAYYLENKDKLKLVAIDDGKGGGCVAPSEATIKNGTYQPLSRPIFIYVKASALQRPEVAEFVKFYLSARNKQYIASTGYIPFEDRIYAQAQERVDKREVGTVFPGRSVEGVKVDDFFSRAPGIPQQ